MWLLWRSFENFCACGMEKCQVLLTGAGTWIGCAVWYEWQVEAFPWKIKPLIITQRYMYNPFMWWILKSAGFLKIEIASQKTQDTDVRIKSWVSGSEIAPSWSPMRLNIQSWWPQLHSWSPASDLIVKLFVIVDFNGQRNFEAIWLFVLLIFFN